jgi:hypothetical protein
MGGNQALAGELMTGMETSPLITFANLLLQEQQRQADALGLGHDNVVDDNQCRR